MNSVDVDVAPIVSPPIGDQENVRRNIGTDFGKFVRRKICPPSGNELERSPSNIKNVLICNSK